MPTPSGHTTAIRASKVKGTTVYNRQGEKLGAVEDVVLDKTSDKIKFAVLGFGGFLGIGEKYHAMPWGVLKYDEGMGGYVVNLDKDILQKAPSYELEDLVRGDGAMSPKLDYYNPYLH